MSHNPALFVVNPVHDRSAESAERATFDRVDRALGARSAAAVGRSAGAVAVAVAPAASGRPRYSAELEPSYGPGMQRTPQREAGPRRATVVRSAVNDVVTPIAAFERLRSLGACMLLESADRGVEVGRYSIIGLGTGQLRWSLGDPGDPFELARQALTVGRALDPAAPETFTGGLAGVFGYDLARLSEPLGAAAEDPIGTPDMALWHVDEVVVLDHLQHRVTVVVTAGDGDRDHADAARRADAIIAATLGHGVEAGNLVAGIGADHDVVALTSKAGYLAVVETARAYIRAGDAFQIVASQRWTADANIDGFALYRALRAVNPSPYMYYFDFGDFEVAGASPEALVAVHGRRVSTRPIAGTRPRPADPADEARVGQELLADPKERAEHVMLVDLGRNDLGRVCTPGTVSVERFMDVETYSHVMHIVSSVAGELAEQYDALDALRATLPAGTLSGAPKVRAMQIIDELEPVKRGLYGGAVGWLGYEGDLDTAILIRSIIVRDGVLHLQAGAGVVADSSPLAEWEESVRKSAVMRQAMAVASGGGTR